MSDFIVKVKSTGEFIEKDFNHGYLKTKKQGFASVFPYMSFEEKDELRISISKSFIGLNTSDLEFLNVFETSDKVSLQIAKGLGVVIRNDTEFKIMKLFLGDYLYLHWAPQMAMVKTSIVIHYNDPDIFSIGSVGDANYQEKNGVRLVEFSDFFKI